MKQFKPEQDFFSSPQLRQGSTIIVPQAVAFVEAQNHLQSVVDSGKHLSLYVFANRLAATASPEAALQMDRDLEALEEHHLNQAQNIRAFRERATFTFQDQTTFEQTNTNRLVQVGAIALEASPDDLTYWTDVRESLRSTFALSLEELAKVLGVSYVTIANLGKRKPQARTERAILRLHNLARAYLNENPVVAREWLRGEGSLVLRDSGLDRFEALIDQRIFANATIPRVAVHSDEGAHELDFGIAPAQRAPRTGERF